MSRHRNVRNLDIDEVLDEDEFVDDYDENELDETQLSNEDLDNLEEGLSYIYSVVGENVPVSATEIKEALWYYYFDREETVNWVLEKIAKYEAEEKKQKAKQAKKNAAQDTEKPAERQPKYRRPPLPMYSEDDREDKPAQSKPAVAQKSSFLNMANKRSPGDSSSLSQLRQRMASTQAHQAASPSTPSGKSSLASLARKPNEVSNNNTPSASPDRRTFSSLSALAAKSTDKRSMQSSANQKDAANVKPNSSLLSLAQKSSGPRGVSALQSLASRQSNQPKNEGKEKSTSTGGSVLAGLAHRSKATSGHSSLAALASRSRQSKEDGSPPAKSMTNAAVQDRITDESGHSANARNADVSDGLSSQPKQPRHEACLTEKPVTTTVSADDEITFIPPKRVSSNALCAPPSAAASFLFMKPEPSAHSVRYAEQLASSLPTSLSQAFYEAMQSSAHNVKLFPFDVPSPDDIVLKAQSQRGGGSAKSKSSS